MKKLLLFTVLAALVATSHAQPKREDLVARVETCEAILQQFMSRPETAIPIEVLKQARALIIVNQFKAGFLFGVKDGYGVVMARKPNGNWSVPVLISAGEASFGLQLGGNAIETIYVITDDNTPKLLFQQRFNVGVDAKAVAGPKVADTEKQNHPIIDAPVLVYSKVRGLYAGATVKAGYLTRADDSNRILYRTQYTMPELLYTDWVQPVEEVRPLMEYVQKLTQ